MYFTNNQQHINDISRSVGRLQSQRRPPAISPTGRT